MSNPSYKNQIRFPNEILIQIFNHLDLTSLIMAGRVCKRWRCIFQIVHDKVFWWRSLRKYSDSDFIPGIIDRYRMDKDKIKQQILDQLSLPKRIQHVKKRKNSDKNLVNLDKDMRDRHAETLKQIKQQIRLRSLEPSVSPLSLSKRIQHEKKRKNSVKNLVKKPDLGFTTWWNEVMSQKSKLQ